MPLERFGILFWFAVAILASRLLLELGHVLAHVVRGVRNVLLLLGRFIATGSARPEVILLVPTAVDAESVAPARPSEPRPVVALTAPATAVLLESMTHDEMDHLLKNWA